MTTQVTVDVKGWESLATAIGNATPRLATELKTTVTAETLELQRHVVQDKLSGQVLHARSGVLRRSITAHVEESGGALRGIVGTNLVYARIHEYGGSVHVPALVPVRARALHWVGPAGDVFAMSTKPHTVTIPARSYRRSALADRRDAILAALRNAIRRAFGR